MYTTASAERVEDTPIKPHENTVKGTADPLGEIVDAFSDYNIDVNAWLVCLHNTHLGTEHPEYRIESAFGDAHDHAFCPSHPAVQRYFANVTEAIAELGVGEIQLESVGFPTVFHPHGGSFGHPKQQLSLSPTARLLASQCFCDGCRTAAETHSVDIEAAVRVVRDLVSDAVASPRSMLPGIEALIQEHGVLQELFDFRRQVIAGLLETLQKASGTTTLNYYAMESKVSRAFDAEWPAGLQYRDMETYLDRLTVLCYVQDPDVAVERLQRHASVVDLPLDAGINMDIDTIENEAQVAELVDAIRDEIDGQISVYHYSMLTEEQLSWVEQAFTPS